MLCSTPINVLNKQDMTPRVSACNPSLWELQGPTVLLLHLDQYAATITGSAGKCRSLTPLG